MYAYKSTPAPSLDDLKYASKRLLLLWLCWLVTSPAAVAETFLLPPGDVGVIGRLEFTSAGRNDTLLDIARRYDIGQNEILLANPDVDRWMPKDDSRVIIPSRYVLPKADRRGVVINLPEMRLYYYPKTKPGQQQTMITHPISVGRMDWRSPLGKTSIISKQTDPSWTPPESIKQEALADGRVLPDVIPGGPDNPLGRFAMRLGIPGYLIHSTNKPYGVGMRVTHGCIRMYPEDIEGLFADIPVGTQVTLVNQPIKLGWLAGALFLELHPPLEEDEPLYQDYLQRVLDAVADMLAEQPDSPDLNADRRLSLSGAALRQAVEEKSGIPIQITR
ncbi:MAG TPA: L,D-transpeptidase family protein [Gammaproteobacteria bacterium]|nr:L,D-transpeptidase family protein [Gammaproteobacteria bacterium]